MSYKLRLHCSKFKKKLINSQFRLRWQDFCDHGGEFMPVSLNHDEWTCSKKALAMTQQASCCFYQNIRSTAGFYSIKWAAECDGAAAVCCRLVKRRSAALMQNGKHVRSWPRGTSTPRPRQMPSILLNLSWCCSSTPRGLQWQQTAKPFMRGTLRAVRRSKKKVQVFKKSLLVNRRGRFAPSLCLL